MKPPKIAFRVDSSLSIGSGHVRRCLALADFFKKKKADVVFFAKNHEGNIHSIIEKEGFQLIELKQASKAWVGEKPFHWKWLGTSIEADAQETFDALKKEGRFDALFVDHYAIDDRWLKPFANEDLVTCCIDDLVDRSLHFDMILNSSLGVSDFDYAQHAPHAKKLLGTNYALLREEFTKERTTGVQIRKQVKHILISFGGIDPTHEVQKTVSALLPILSPNMHLHIVPGSQTHLEAQTQQMTIHKNTNKVAELMKSCDLAFGAPGTMTWERCAMGLPSVVTILAPNQELNAREGEKAGFQICLGTSNEVTVDHIKDVFLTLKNDSKKLQDMSTKAKQTVDTLGTKRVYDALMEKLK